jgi:HK97 family phage major capsid protein
VAQTTVEWRAEASADELRTRATEMRSEWAELAKGGRESDTYRDGKRDFLAEVEDIDTQLTLRSMERPAALRGVPAGAQAFGEQRDYRTPGEIVVANEQFRAWAENAARRGTGIGESPAVDLRNFELRATGDLTNTVAEGDAHGSSSLLPVGQPYLVDTRRRRLFIRDLVSVQQTTLSGIPYVRELNTVANATTASTVKETFEKPDAEVEFTPDFAPVQVIATTIPITTQILEDAATLVGYINGRLIYMLKYREEDEILRGNGVTPDLKGILSYSDVQTVTTNLDDPIRAIADAIAKIELVDGYADGVAMNPADYWSMVTNRATSSGVLDVGAFSSAPTQYVWGLPVVRTNSMNSLQFVVGNFQMGATLFDRSQAGVRVFEQHADFAKKNMVLLRAEERVALAVNRPDFFVKGTLSA